MQEKCDEQPGHRFQQECITGNNRNKQLSAHDEQQHGHPTILAREQPPVTLDKPAFSHDRPSLAHDQQPPSSTRDQHRLPSDRTRDEDDETESECSEVRHQVINTRIHNSGNWTKEHIPPSLSFSGKCDGYTAAYVAAWPFLLYY